MIWNDEQDVGMTIILNLYRISVFTLILKCLFFLSSFFGSLFLSLRLSKKGERAHFVCRIKKDVGYHLLASG